VIGASRTRAGVQHATLWQAGRIRDLGTLSPRLGFSTAVAINGRGQIAGRSFNAHGPYGRRAFVWQGGVMRDLGSLGGLETDVRAINGRGDIIGMSTTPAGRGRAVLWKLRSER
jgi:probable HAF family extracellular repeat protein